ncbi:SDR family NAD(P)-dependent oxidoreductase [Nocardia cyriacigeorgica]|uniref:SDR family NAD(P)-dependent oxidoreductase n=1 Tax=Nocardia cyriacigeorgica TaxID=135487 RepID=UPI001895F732|nr:SDR family NAD(P)-dependent oxidoreductase [Nocardia cyriacigeorgica]MBF6319528.1 SDR family NAD(P)-dependent oxidoreductase [Nocardia cyriacigeorgica]MBF6397431.1 SDR family NAD(P)-dependent oxidoreductase [Nocardia cyriacigeorgica]MBF6402911.1 SDR family NAD(P)-dependent oxidoreductase [Nocardia cyriacigeorgica]MBF6533688.1 SDR family NAD(P)-dependent oxidoreductase [Nocardia cyriacigeorgica]
MGELTGRTVLVTGAGRGIGRAEAIHLAAAGANVIVNDPGVAIDGSGCDASVAARVVEEIRAAGGNAIADHGSVADWGAAERMVRRAVAEFGDLHAVVNNATIEVNKGLERLSESEFDDVVAVKLKGTFAVSRWATAYWRERYEAGDRADRAIVNSASGSGLLNPLPTQTNYAAANAGVAAMTTVHALELRRLGVRVNCISPSMIRTRLTEQVPGMNQTRSGGFDPTDPMVVAPLVAYLVGSSCPLTGQVLSVRGGSIAVNHGWSRGARIEKTSSPWTMAELGAELEQLPLEDPFDRLATAIGGALGVSGREQFEALVNAQLDRA